MGLLLVVVVLLDRAAHNLGAVQQPQRAQRDVVIQLQLSFQDHSEITYEVESLLGTRVERHGSESTLGGSPQPFRSDRREGTTAFACKSNKAPHVCVFAVCLTSTEMHSPFQKYLGPGMIEDLALPKGCLSIVP